MRVCVWLLSTLLLVGGPAIAQEATTAPTKGMAPAVYWGTSIASQSSDLGEPTPTKGVPLKRRNGVWWLTIELNGAVTVDCTLDTGSGPVMVDEGIYAKLKSAGPVEEEPTLRPSILADGSQRLFRSFTIKSLRLGNVTVTNIYAGVFPALSSPLLGQSFLDQFKSWSIDNVKQELMLGEMITPAVAQTVPVSPRR